MRRNIIKDKSFQFAVKVVNLYKTLSHERKEFVLSKQLLKPGTSVGANVREAINAESKADFIHKLAIAQKECDETMYWMELLRETDYINEKEFAGLHGESGEILKIIKSIILTTKKKKTHNL